MKKFLALAVLMVIPLMAETPEISTSELKVQLADSQQKVAELEQQILELQVRLVLAERAALPEIDQARQRAQQKVQAAKDAAMIAHATAETPKK